jgi:heterodisulfide reductase subunit A
MAKQAKKAEKDKERIGVFLCHCGTNISGQVDIPALVEYVRKLPGVAFAEDYKFMCSQPGQDLLKESIKKYKLTKAIVAACSPLMHENTFRKACEEAGLNRYCFLMVNNREHNSWVTEDKDAALRKAKDLVRAAVARAFWIEPLEVKEVDVNPNVLVVGGGIAGIQAALDLAEAGRKVYLVEREQTIGGNMSKFDKTFPTLDCSACILTPKMVSVGQHPNIVLWNYSEIEDVGGFVGNFKVKVRRKATSVNYDKCTGCGLCQEKCPIKVTSEYDEGMGIRKAIYTAFPQAVPPKPVIDREHCTYFIKGKCRLCEKVCEVGAIDFEMQDKIEEIDVGSIILATGYHQWDPVAMPQLGYGKYDNVITGLQFERLSNSSGPTGGKIQLKDGSEPESVAILHCMGSRDVNYHEYCSRVCCMYALKFAHLIKEKTSAEVYNFYIDMRCFGKGYEEFYHRLMEEGVTFVRGKAASVTDKPEDSSEQGKLIVIAEDTLTQKILRVPVDMVILCAAIENQLDSDNIARMFKISKSADGFFLEKHPKLAPVGTANDGVFIAGTCQGPKDIPDTVAQAQAASSAAMSLTQSGKIELEATTCYVDEELCSGCQICINVCAYQAISFDEEKKVSVISDAVCKGCGTCAAACPSKAIFARHFTNQQILAELEGVLNEHI